MDRITDLEYELHLLRRIATDILKEFDLSSYDLLADQNEIITEIKKIAQEYKDEFCV